MSLTTSLLTALAGITVTCILARTIWPTKKKLPLPPGPSGLPLLGAVTSLPPPSTVEAYHWHKHLSLYGPISSVTVLGQTLIIINDADVATELLTSRYSSRPRMVFAGDMVGWRQSLAFEPCPGRAFKQHRKAMARGLSGRFDGLLEGETAHLLLRLVDANSGHEPARTRDSAALVTAPIRSMAGSIILRIVYGYTPSSQTNDALVELVGRAMAVFGIACVPGAWAVDTLPFLRYLPSWLPGASFKRLANQWSAELVDTADVPFAFVKHQMASAEQEKEYEPSIVSRTLSEKTKTSKDDEHLLKWTALSLYSGGADTTVAALSVFFLAMTLNPSIQHLAQAELDRVTPDRLPTLSDRSSLPYITATVKEALRWHTIAPMGFPHTLSSDQEEDDIFRGYRIPKNAVLMPNIWAFTHDPTRYPDPETFKPERFLGPKPERDPADFVFGFGRRVCPGRHLAEDSLFVTIAQALAVFDIARPESSEERTVTGPRFVAGLISHPEPFPVVVRPRSKKHEEMVRGLKARFPWRDGDEEVLRGVKGTAG